MVPRAADLLARDDMRDGVDEGTADESCASRARVTGCNCAPHGDEHAEDVASNETLWNTAAPQSGAHNAGIPKAVYRRLCPARESLLKAVSAARESPERMQISSTAREFSPAPKQRSAS